MICFCDIATVEQFFHGCQTRYGATEVIPKKVRGVVIVYIVTALVGGFVSCILLWPYGAAIALLSMPFSGSLFALLAAILVYMRASDEAVSSDDRVVYLDDLSSCRPPIAFNRSQVNGKFTLSAPNGDMTYFRETTAISELTGQPVSNCLRNCGSLGPVLKA